MIRSPAMPERKPARPAAPGRHIHIGIHGSVVAVRRDNGEIAWSTKLRKGHGLVPIVLEGDRLFAASGGELSCLDAASGRVVWHNPLKGYGMGFAMLSGSQDPGAAAAAIQAAAAAAGAAAAAS
jgi:outer membrane protein assembly factor BamB